MKDRFDASGRLRIPEAKKLVEEAGGLRITQDKLLVEDLFCHNGHPLVKEGNHEFGAEPGVELLGKFNDETVKIYLSPYYGDRRKFCAVSIPDQTVLELCCPTCAEPFPRLAPHDCQEGAMYQSLFLGPEADVSNAVGVCSTWGCHASFIRLSSEVITDLRALAPFPWV